MRQRLRLAHSPAELAQLYPEPHRHDRWDDHILRVNLTIEIARSFPRYSVADLSCGDGAIVRALDPQVFILGDLARGHPLCGPIEETIDLIETVDLFICTETLEHLDDPDAVLRKIRSKARSAVFSTPIGEFEPHNVEHYWGWDLDDLEKMLIESAWTPVISSTLHMPRLGAHYQIWGCQ